MQQIQDGSAGTRQLTKHERDIFAVVKNLQDKIKLIESMLAKKAGISAECGQILVFAMESLTQTLRIIQQSVCHHNHKVWDEETARPSLCLVCKHVFPQKERQQQ